MWVGDRDLIGGAAGSSRPCGRCANCPSRSRSRCLGGRRGRRPRPGRNDAGHACGMIGRPLVACRSYPRSRRGSASSIRSCRPRPCSRRGRPIATLKTFDPPSARARGPRLEGAGRRGKWLLFPTADGALQPPRAPDERRADPHLAAGAKGPKSPAFRLRFENGSELVLTEADRRSAPASGSSRRSRPRRSWPHLGPEALTLGVGAAAGDPRRRQPAAPLAPPRSAALTGIGRAHANEILHRAQLSPFALSSKLDEEEIDRLADAIDEDLSRALELRLAGKGDKDVYLVHRRLGEPCPRCGDPLRQSTTRSTPSSTAPPARPAAGC